MNQTFVTEGGLLLRDLNVNTIEDTFSDTKETDSTKNVLSDLEKSYFDFKAKTEFKDYVAMYEAFVKVLKGSYKDLNSLLEAQVKNYDLDQAGWMYLLKLVEYLKFEAELDVNNTQLVKKSDSMRIKLGTYFSYPTFKTTVRSEDQTEDGKLQISKVRASELSKLLSELGFDSYSVDMIDSFIAVMYRDLTLTTNTIRLFFFKS